MEYLTLSPPTFLLPVDIAVSVVVGGAIAMVRWLSRPKGTLGSLARALLLWIGFLFGFSMLRSILTILVWTYY